MSDAGLFTSGLKFLGRPNKVILNALKGNWEGAGRQALDIFGDLADASLPGDLIPEFSREEDSPEFSELIGGMDDGFAKSAVDILGGVVTDPLSYVPVLGWAAKGARAAGGAAARVAAKVAPDATAKVLEGAGRVGAEVRSIAGAQRMSPAAREIADAAEAAGNLEARTSTTAAQQVVQGLSTPEREIVSDVMDNLGWRDGVPATLVAEDIPQAAYTRVRSHPGVTAENAERIEKAVVDAALLGQEQSRRVNIFSKPARGDAAIFGAAPRESAEQALSFGDDFTAPAAAAPEALVSGQAVSAMKPEYLARQYRGQTQEQMIDELLGRGPAGLGLPNPLKAQELSAAEDIGAHLAKNPGVKYERDAGKRLLDRASTQGELAKRAELGKRLTGDEGFVLSNPEGRKAVEAQLREMAQTEPEAARVFSEMFNGRPPRGAFLDALSKANRFFKPFAVYGAVIPKFGSIVRNKVGGAWQALSNPEARGTALAQASRIPSDITGAVASSLGMKAPDRLGKLVQEADAAFAGAQGSVDNALRAMSPEVREAFEAGAMDGWTTSEELLKEIGRTPWQKKFMSVVDWPGRIFRGVEDRMRLGMFTDLRAQGKTAQDAVRIVKDSLYDYKVSSVGNRTARDIIPFFQFTAKAVPQQAKFLAEGTLPSRLALSGISQTIGAGEENDVYPWMDGKLNLRLGDDEQGNPQYASGLGLPFESLNMLPNPSANPLDFGRQVERGIVSSLSPPLKSAYALVSGQDPFSEQPFLSYDKAPIVGRAGNAGRAYNALAGTGMIQPLDSPLRLVDKAIDPRRSTIVKALDLLTGANVQSVDPDRAEQMRINELLVRNPSVKQYRTFWQSDDDRDQDVVAQLESVRGASKRLRDKRKLQAQ